MSETRFKQLILARTDLRLTRGKLAVQCCHASLEAYRRALEEDLVLVNAWLTEGQAKIVLKVSSRQEIITYYDKLKRKFPCALIKDAGLTQLKPGTITCLGVGPAEAKKLDKITSSLKLL